MDIARTEFVLSADFALKTTNEMLSSSLLEEYPELDGRHALVDGLHDTAYLINESIFSFLTLFSSPASLDSLRGELGEDIASSSQVEQFVHDLLRKEILVSKERNEEIRQLMEQEEKMPPAPVDTAGVIKVLKHTDRIWIGLVRDASRPSPYVLKKLLLPPALPAGERKRRIREFKHEVAMHQAVGGHPHIVALLDADLKQYAMKLEYVEGKSIRKFVKQCNPSLAERCRLIEKILAIFSYLHARNILHGDIHSSNFLVTDDQRPMLFDFDMARDDGENGRKAAKVGGVYPYAPPERVSTAPMQVFNRMQISRTAEVYQLGIIFYLVLYHELPFEGVTWKDLSGSILSLPPVWKPHTPAGEEIPPALIAVVQKALEKKPQNRYADVEEFASAWEHATGALRVQPCN